MKHNELAMPMNNSYGANIGMLYHPKGSCVPLVLPLSAGGYIVEHSKDRHQDAYLLLQKITLSFISVLTAPLVTIHVFDFSLKNPFKELAQLKDTGIYNSYSEKNAPKAYEELEELIRYRHYELLTGHEDIQTYNRNSPQKEKYHIILWNIEHIVHKFGSSKDLHSFIDASREAGIYILAYGLDETLESLSNHERKDVVKATKTIIAAYSSIYLEKEIMRLKPVDEHTLKLKQLIKRFSLVHDVNINITEIAQHANNVKECLLSASDDHSKDFLRLPVGTSLDGRTAINFSLGDYSGVYHAFIAGTNGTGKTTLINNIILGIAENYTAKQVKLFLMDYKHGVEFQQFENHPNCERLFLDNSNLAAAKDLIDEFAGLMEKRREQFIVAGTSNIDDYNHCEPGHLMPRIILIIDEVQRLFSGEWKEQNHFEKQLANVVRQGRGFGIHVIMSTQTLTGANISPAIMSQIPLRIAFKLISSEIWKIYASNNDEPARLGKYQFIYNKDAGERAGNLIVRANPPSDISSQLSIITKNRNDDEIVLPIVFGKESAVAVANQKEELPLVSKSSESQQHVESVIEEFKPIDLSEYSLLLSDLNREKKETLGKEGVIDNE